MYVSYFFAEVSAPDVHAYFRERIQKSHAAVAQVCGSSNLLLAPSLVENYAVDLARSLPDFKSVPMGPSANLDALPDDVGKIARRRYSCMIQEIDTLFPALDDEKTEKDDVSYLTADYQGHPAGSITLKRITNLSTIYYIYPKIRWDINSQTLVETGLQRGVLASAPMTLLGAGGIDFGSAAKSLASGLTGLAPAPFDIIGSALLDALWPSSDDAENTWKQVYENLQTILKNELAQDRITTASNKIKGVVNFLNTRYLIEKAAAIETRDGKKFISEENKKFLYGLLNPYDVTFFTEVMNELMSFKDGNVYDQQAAVLANFMLGANVHLGMFQEFALVDWRYDDPTKSPSANVIRQLAKNYGKYAGEIAPYVKSVRLAQISEVKSDSSTFCRGGPAASCTTNYWFWFEDSNNSYKSNQYSYSSAQKNPPDVKGDANRARQDYYNHISGEMDQTLQSQVFEVINQWKKLETDPLTNWEKSLSLTVDR
jgi:hypothetical protein